MTRHKRGFRPKLDQPDYIVEDNCWLAAGDPRRAQGAYKPYAPRRAGAPFWFRRIPAAAGSLLLVARARERC